MISRTAIVMHSCRTRRNGENMALENKLGTTDSVELARQEERISKKKAKELFESGYKEWGIIPALFLQNKLYFFCKMSLTFFAKRTILKMQSELCKKRWR